MSKYRLDASGAMSQSDKLLKEIGKIKDRYKGKKLTKVIETSIVSELDDLCERLVNEQWLPVGTSLDMDADELATTGSITVSVNYINPPWE